MTKKIFAILLIAILLRFLLSSLTFHADILSQANWGQNIFEDGAKNFYSRNEWIFSWPNHPPLTSLYYGFCYKIFLQTSAHLYHLALILNKLGIWQGIVLDKIYSFDKLVSANMPFPLGYLLCLKFFPILFDLLIGLIFFYIAKKHHRDAYKFLLIYLFSPFSWYVSSLWGQTDQISFYFSILAFLLVLKSPIVSILIFFISISIKPTSIFMFPLFIYILLKNRISKKNILLGFLISCGLGIYILSRFTDKNLVDFTLKILIPRIFDRPPRLTTNAYNFWHMFTLDKGLSNMTKFFYVPGIIWGGFAYILINLVSFKLVEKNNLNSIIKAFFVVSFGSWLFLTDMLDRYSFGGIVSGLFLIIMYPNLFWHWLILSLIYWLNLFRGWWYPNFLSPIKNILISNNYIAGLFLSFGNTFVYLLILRFLLTKKLLTTPDDKK